jgi:hypothetical protein
MDTKGVLLALTMMTIYSDGVTTSNGKVSNDRRVTILMPTDLFDDAAQMAIEEDRSVSWIIREALNAYMHGEEA